VLALQLYTPTPTLPHLRGREHTDSRGCRKLPDPVARAKKLTRQAFCVVYGARVIVSQEKRDRVSATLGRCGRAERIGGKRRAPQTIFLEKVRLVSLWC